MTDIEIAKNLLADMTCDTCRVMTQTFEGNIGPESKVYFCFNPELKQRNTCKYWKK